MKGSVIKSQNELKIRVSDPMYGVLYLTPDNESRNLLDASHICAEVEGFITKSNETTPSGVKANTWRFHIESFEE